MPSTSPGTPTAERLLTPAEFGEITGTTERLARRLIAERRIRFCHVGKYVRIPALAVAEYVAANTVAPAGHATTTRRAGK